MRYAILVHETADGFAARTDPARKEAYWTGTMRYLEALRNAGVFVGGAGLEPPETATTLRHQDGQPLVQDGPFVDTKEQLGGFFLVDVPSLEVALEWAARFPPRPGVVVEVRAALSADS